MEIIFIIIVVVIISLVSAAGKKKASQSSTSSEDAPVRTAMSDIQKAFMMASNMDTPPRRAPETTVSHTVSSPMTARQSEAMSSRLNVPANESSLTANVVTNQNKYANINLVKFRAESADDKDVSPLKAVKRHDGTLRLFEDKSDFVRAVIYSEILPRKAR